VVVAGLASAVSLLPLAAGLKPALGPAAAVVVVTVVLALLLQVGESGHVSNSAVETEQSKYAMAICVQGGQHPVSNRLQISWLLESQSPSGGLRVSLVGSQGSSTQFCSRQETRAPTCSRQADSGSMTNCLSCSSRPMS